MAKPIAEKLNPAVEAAVKRMLARPGTTKSSGRKSQSAKSKRRK